MQVATDKSPELTIPYRYLFTGLFVLIVISAGIILKAEAFKVIPYGSPTLLPLTHLVTLGWITMTIIGAMFQLVPVITEQNLYSETIARVVFYIYIVGLAWLIYAFSANKPAGIGAGIVSLGLVLFIGDSWLTMRAVRNADLAIWYVITAMFFLFLTLLTGSFAASGMYHAVAYNNFELLFLHIAFAGIGWVSFVVIGFSFRLIPMFILSHGYKESYGWVSFIMLLSGVMFISVYFLFNLFTSRPDLHWVELAGGFLILIGIIIYILQIYVIYKQRTRRQIEPAIWFTICATAYLFIASVTGVGMIIFQHSFQVEIAYVITGLFGFAGMYIIGMMHKIVPFLQWYNKYSSKIGLEKVPMTKDMISEPLTWSQLILFNLAIITFVIGILTNKTDMIRLSGMVMLIGSIIFVLNMIKVLRS